MHFSTYGFLFNYVLLVLYFFSCLFVVFQAELFVVFPPVSFGGGIGYLLSATDRIIVHLSAFFILASVWREGRDRCFVEFCMMKACVFFMGLVAPLPLLLR